MTRNDSLTIHLSDPTKFPFTSQQELLPNLAVGLTKGMPLRSHDMPRHLCVA